MTAKDVLVVFKKNFEEVHDESLRSVRAELDRLADEGTVTVGYKVRETVTSDDFANRDLAVILGGDGTLRQMYRRRKEARNHQVAHSPAALVR